MDVVERVCHLFFPLPWLLVGIEVRGTDRKMYSIWKRREGRKRGEWKKKRKRERKRKIYIYIYIYIAATEEEKENKKLGRVEIRQEKKELTNNKKKRKQEWNCWRGFNFGQDFRITTFHLLHYPPKKTWDISFSAGWISFLKTPEGFIFFRILTSSWKKKRRWVGVLFEIWKQIYNVGTNKLVEQVSLQKRDSTYLTQILQVALFLSFTHASQPPEVCVCFRSITETFQKE